MVIFEWVRVFLSAEICLKNLVLPNLRKTVIKFERIITLRVKYQPKSYCLRKTMFWGSPDIILLTFFT